MISNSKYWLVQYKLLKDFVYIYGKKALEAKFVNIFKSS